MSAREGVEVAARCSTHARARDVEGTAVLGRHVSPFFCPRATTCRRSHSLTEPSLRRPTDRVVLALIISQTGSSYEQVIIQKL
jgi:hypothetical protein